MNAYFISFKNNIKTYAKTSTSIFFKCVLWVLIYIVFWLILLNTLQLILISSLTKELVQASKFWMFFKDFIYFFERGEGKEKERERNINVQEIHPLAASCTLPTGEPGPQPRHTPWLGIEPATFWFEPRQTGLNFQMKDFVF